MSLATALRRFLEKANDPTGTKRELREQTSKAETDLALIRSLQGNRYVPGKSVEELLPLIKAESSVLQGILRIIAKYPENAGGALELLQKLEKNLVEHIAFMKKLV